MMKGYSKIKGKTSFIKRSKSNKEFLFLDKDFDDFSTKSSCKKSHFHEQKPSIIIGDDNDGVEDHVYNNKKNDFFLGKSNEYDDGGYDSHSLKSEGGERTKGVLWRNLSVSSTTSSYHKNNNSNNKNNNNNNNSNSNNMMMNSSLERQSSTRTIHEAVKRAFSRKRSTSVNSDKYSRIHDQPMNGDDDDFENVHDVYNKHHNHVDDDDDDDDFVDAVDAVDDDGDVGRQGSLAARSVTMINKNHHDDHTNNNNNNNNIKNNNNNNNNSRKHVGSKVVRACKRLFSR